MASLRGGGVSNLCPPTRKNPENGPDKAGNEKGPPLLKRQPLPLFDPWGIFRFNV